MLMESLSEESLLNGIATLASVLSEALIKHDLSSIAKIVSLFESIKVDVPLHINVENLEFAWNEV